MFWVFFPVKEKKDTWLKIKLNSCFKMIVLVWGVSYIERVLGYIFEENVILT